MAFGLNRYTGLHRTPIELAWLIRQHQRLQSEIARAAQVEQALGRARDQRRLEFLQEQLRCLDVVIRLHPAEFDPRTIPAVRHKAARLYSYGSLSRDLLNLLRRRAGKPISTAHAARTIAKARGLVLDAPMRQRNHKTVLKQLNALQSGGLVEVVPGGLPGKERYWRLRALPD
jgi:hypothetical protein